MRFSSSFPVLALTALLLLPSCAWIGFEQERGNPVDEEKVKEITAFPYEQMSPDAPPPPKPEFRGSPPGNIPDEYTWRSGHWDYKDRAGFSWVNGYWLRKPAFSAAWKQDMWVQRAYGWTFVPGYWQ